MKLTITYTSTATEFLQAYKASLRGNATPRVRTYAVSTEDTQLDAEAATYAVTFSHSNALVAFLEEWLPTVRGLPQVQEIILEYNETAVEYVAETESEESTPDPEPEPGPAFAIDCAAVLDGTIPDGKAYCEAHADALVESDYEALLAYEIEHKDRKGMREYLEAQLED